MARADKVSTCSFMASDMDTHIQYMRFEVLGSALRLWSLGM